MLPFDPSVYVQLLLLHHMYLFLLHLLFYILFSFEYPKHMVLVLVIFEVLEVLKVFELVKVLFYLIFFSVSAF
eukprot:jgi/Orpsp1_1/1189984/evm.model.d7180000075936.1